MKICKECGIPVVLGRDQEWNPNGTVTLVGDPNIRMGIYCMEMLTDLVARIEKVVGPPINNMLMEG
jgi:hypothetical protein